MPVSSVSAMVRLTVAVCALALALLNHGASGSIRGRGRAHAPTLPLARQGSGIDTNITCTVLSLPNCSVTAPCGQKPDPGLWQQCLFSQQWDHDCCQKHSNQQCVGLQNCRKILIKDSIANCTGRREGHSLCPFGNDTGGPYCVYADEQYTDTFVHQQCQYGSDAAVTVEVVGGAITVVSAAVILVTYHAFPSWRGHPADLIWWTAATDLLFGARFVATAWPIDLAPIGCSVTMCGVLALLTQFLLFASEGAILTLYIYRGHNYIGP